jgi:hypothetical protein
MKQKTLKLKTQKGGTIVVQGERLLQLREHVIDQLNKPSSTGGPKLFSSGHTSFTFMVNIPQGIVTDVAKGKDVVKLLAKVVVLSDEKDEKNEKKYEYEVGDKEKKFFVTWEDVESEKKVQNNVYEKSLAQLGYPLSVRVIDTFQMSTWGKMSELQIDQHNTRKTGFGVILMPYAGSSFLDYLRQNIGRPRSIEEVFVRPDIQEVIKMIRLKMCDLENIGITHKDLHWENVCVETNATNTKQVDNVLIIDYGMVQSTPDQLKTFFGNLMKRYYSNPVEFEATDVEDRTLMYYFLRYLSELRKRNGFDAKYDFLNAGLEKSNGPKRFFPSKDIRILNEEQVFSTLANYTETVGSVPNVDFSTSVHGKNISIPVNQMFALQQRVANLEIGLRRALERTGQMEQKVLPQPSFIDRFKFWKRGGGKTLKKRRRRLHRSQRLI